MIESLLNVDSSNLSLKAPAKINLYLKVLSRRPDGYHEIDSIMQKVALFDVLHFSRSGGTITLSCQGKKVPGGQENLVYRAARAFLNATGEKAGVRIILEKNIPVAAGLGGGSSDAAAVLHGLNRLLGVDLDLEHLMEIGLSLGADVPFFIHDYSSAAVTGIGEYLQEVEPLENYWLLLVNPGFPVSTKWVYENFPLTSNSNPYILARGQKGSDHIKGVLPAMIGKLGNDLEAVSINRYPEIGEIKKELIKAGAVASLMSGSGPTVFGLFPEIKRAQRSFAIITKKYGNNVFLVRPYIP